MSEEVFRDIETRDSMDACHLCGKRMKDSPWSICYDPFYSQNSWGGDTHEYKALLCQKCAEGLLLKKPANWDKLKPEGLAPGVLFPIPPSLEDEE